MASIRPQIAAKMPPSRETAQQKMARQQVIRSKQMFNRPVKQLKSAIPNTIPLGSPMTPEQAARNKALQTPIQQTTATLAPGMKSTADAPQMTPEQVAQMDARLKGPLGQTIKGSTGLPTGPSNAVQQEAEAQKNIAMAQKQAQTANAPKMGPPDTAMPAVMAKGGMVKKPAAKKMAKGGVVMKANCGASVPPSQKFKK